jgi:calpain-7
VSSQELWVSIIEKAYMKVNGGYDFPGSNSGIDMFALTGWIPEQFNTHDERGDFDAKRLWERMLSASKFGDCLLTVATGELAELNGEEEEKVGLVRTHAYAVLQVHHMA